MNTTDILFGLLSSVGIAYLVFWRFKQYRIDKFRQAVFALRDELFDYAATGSVDFKHPAYITLRNLMNGYIRFSHRISLVQIIVLVLSSKTDYEKKDETQFEYVWQNVTADLEPKVKQDLELLNLRANSQLFYYVFLSSLIKKIFVIPFIAVLFFKHLLVKHSKAVANKVELPQKQPKNFELITFKISTDNSEQVENSIDYLNSDALIFGSIKPSTKSYNAAVV